jgi:hypothetical protein
MSNKLSDKQKNLITECADKIEEYFNAFKKENSLFINKSNQQASKRARVASIKLTNLTKEYRQLSIKAANKLRSKK